MATRKSIGLLLLAIVSSLLLSSVASAQQADWPTLKANMMRWGYNPNDVGPGMGNLDWFTPSSPTNQYTTTLIVDNTDYQNNPYDAVLFPKNGGVNPAGSFSTSSSALWLPDPLTSGGASNIDAAGPYLEGDPTTNPQYQNERVPAYVYASCVASVKGDPTSKDPNSPGQLAYATWDITPTGSGNFALYVWIPTGPQVDALKNPSETFPQEFYVYQVTTAGRTFTDIVDTYISGGGWVRLGNAGGPTNMVFPSDGFNPISIKLYNTVPRDISGNLLWPVVPGTTLQFNPVPVVYADAAMAVPAYGAYDAGAVSATLTGGGISVVSALNQFSSGGGSSGFTTVVTGVVNSQDYQTGASRWSYTPAESGVAPVLWDVTQANLLPAAPSPWTVYTAQPGATTNYGETAPIVNGGAPVNGVIPVANATATATYTPSLNTGTYQIYAWLPGNSGTTTFGAGVEYLVYEGSTVTACYVPQSAGGGWVQVGTRRFSNVQSTPTSAAAQLSVVVTNLSYDPYNSNGNTTDVGSSVYADALKFVGEQSPTISNTPVIATAMMNLNGGGSASKQVVIVGDESGVLHCLDYAGNGDGTTTEYWSYPNASSTANATLDMDSEMPTGFNLSSALVTNTPNGPRLYIGTTNGRVYCLDVAGRGDYTATQAGTTRRIWAYPATPGTSSNLGSFRGSVSTNISYSIAGTDQTIGTKLIYVPTIQGRIYALPAIGGLDAADTSPGRSVTPLWEYPDLKQPNLGEIWTTPTYKVFNGKPYLYFGTRINPVDDSQGQFYCLDVSNSTSPAQVWAYPGNATVTVPTSDFLSSPVIVTQSDLYPTGTLYPQPYPNPPYSTTDGYVYAVNQNNYVYAFDAVTGTVVFSTNELNVGALGATSLTYMDVYNNNGVLAPGTPVVMVPTLDGRFDALFADPAVTNQYGTRRAWEYVSASTEVASSMAMSNGWMYGTDESGFLYAFNNATSNLGTGVIPPGSPTITENNPKGDIFRNAKVMLVTQLGYNKLRQPTGQNLDYYTATAQTNNPYAFTRSPLAFEWGESAYIMVYDFPYINTQSGNNNVNVAPPIINVTFSSQGKNVTRQAEARQFANPTNAPIDPTPYNGQPVTDSGYAILQVPLGSGSTALVPGSGTISVSISSSALNGFGAQQTVALNPKYSNIPFFIANPIGLGMKYPLSNLNDVYEIGYNVSPSDPEALVNGSPAIPSNTGHVSGKLTQLIGTSAGDAHHGSSITTTVYPFDRSMMASLQPANTPGLNLVRMMVNNLGWQGGANAVTKPLNPTYYANFEDYPVNYPNNSIDYPDIQSTQLQVVTNPNGVAQNPLYGNGVGLNPPMILDPNTGFLRSMQLGDDPRNRVFQATPTNVTINVPRFQPANTTAMVASANNAVPGSGYLVNDSSGAVLPYQGYLGRLRIYVDSNTNHILDTSPAEAYRGFNLSTTVDVDEKITISTPTVSLGTLGQGTGYNPMMPGAQQGYSNNSATNIASSIFEPWGGYGSTLFQPFIVNNEGNVNLTNVRLAKYNALGSNAYPWFIPSSSNDILGWLDGSTDVWSDIDEVFAPEQAPGTGYNEVIIQKARVTDISPTQLTANPVRRANPNNGTTGYISGTQITDVANPTLVNGQLKYPPVAPRVAVSVPIGLPVGPYQQQMRVIEKGNNSETNEAWQVFNGAPETASDPTFMLNFNVRESQLTTSATPFTSPMVDNLLPPSINNTFGYSNVQPAAMRDSYGSLLVAWSSDRPSWVPNTPKAANQLGNYKIYMASVGNGASFKPLLTGTIDPQNPLGDLNSFTPASSAQWFNQAVAAYPPQSPILLFGLQANETVVPGTLQYGNPSFPLAGSVNPFNTGQTFFGTYMAFTGSMQKQTQEGRLGESALFITQVQSSAGGGLSAPTQPIALTSDPLTTKGRPAVLQTVQGALVFYPGTTGNRSNIYYTYFNGTSFGNPIALPFGSGFQSISDISVSGRTYNGRGESANGALLVGNGTPLADVTFTGQMAGRSNAEVFFGRLRLDPTTYAVVDDAGVAIDNPATDGNAFIDLSPRTGEVMVTGSQPGQYRAQGLLWDANAFINIQQTLNGVTSPLIVTGSAVFDRQTGLISFDSSLGGKVYVDTRLGTVRFTSGIPNQSAQIIVSYTPRFLRVSAPGGSGYAKPSVMFDFRAISNPTYWRRANGNGADYSDAITNDRYLLVYNKAAGGPGAPPRPYMTSLRFGIQLPFRIYVDQNGVPEVNGVTDVKIQAASGTIGPFQIDAANGRIYFTGADEDNIVTVSYTAVSDSGSTSFITVPYQMQVGLIGEMSPLTATVGTGAPANTFTPGYGEQQILIDNAVNEGDVTAFIDPFTYFPSTSRRPPLTWLFWSSTRKGVPDIYFETISPQWPSIPLSQ